MADKSYQELIITNFGLAPSGYTGSQGAAGYTGSAGAGAAVPTISSIAYPGNDTAADPAGGQTITLTGTGFAAGATVIVNGNVVPVLSVVNSTTITFTTPAASAGSYIIYVVNTNGTTALAVPGLQYSGTPAWTTSAGSLGTPTTNTSFSANVVATGDAPISYSVYSGSLPSGMSLNSNTGVISGTTPTVASNTTYNFTIRATDAQNQDTDRAFSLTVNLVAPPSAVDFLLVGGGGSGGYAQSGSGGGGGAGGFRTSTGISGQNSSAESMISVSAGVTYTITVGAGGTAASVGSLGNNSTISGPGLTTMISFGGGKGGTTYSPSTDASAGGSGGGAANWASGGAGYAGQGYAGGGGVTSGYTAAGGGGAGAVGGNTSGADSTSTAGSGGVGLQNSITGTATYYAGGGGGGVFSTQTAGSGGTGGGGRGGKSGLPPGNGVAGTGGGGGGGGYEVASNGVVGTGANGGSGIVVLRYADTYGLAASTTGSPTVTTSGGYRVYQWTTSGSITF